MSGFQVPKGTQDSNFSCILWRQRIWSSRTTHLQSYSAARFSELQFILLENIKFLKKRIQNKCSILRVFFSAVKVQSGESKTFKFVYGIAIYALRTRHQTWNSACLWVMRKIIQKHIRYQIILEWTGELWVEITPVLAEISNPDYLGMKWWVMGRNHTVLAEISNPDYLGMKWWVMGRNHTVSGNFKPRLSWDEMVSYG